MVVQAYVLIQTEVGKAADVAKAIGDIPGVTMAEDVTGPYDVIVRAEAGNVDELGKPTCRRSTASPGLSPARLCISDRYVPPRIAGRRGATPGRKAALSRNSREAGLGGGCADAGLAAGRL